MTRRLDAFERWMAQSNLERISDGEDRDTVVATLRANGYDRVADAVEAEIEKWWR